MLTEREVLSHLLQRGLVSRRQIVEGDLHVLNASRRNRNYKVISEKGASYLVKQGVGEEGRATLAREAAVYALLRRTADQSRLHRYVTRAIDDDGAGHLLVLDLVRNALTLREHHLRHGRFSRRLGGQIGDAMGAFHASTRLEHLSADDRWLFGARRPWVLGLHRPGLDMYRDVSGGNVGLIRMIQHFPDFPRLLDELGAAWTDETLVHFDVKSDNYLVVTEGLFSQGLSRRRTSRVVMIDWEMAGGGDPCWDVGSVFSDYLAFWLLSMPVTGDTPPDRLMDVARYPLGRMWPALRAFWHAYVERMHLDPGTASERLTKSVRFAAARLVQTAFEQTQMAAKPTGNTVCLLQLSLNMMRRPDAARVALLGIEPEAVHS